MEPLEDFGNFSSASESLLVAGGLGGGKKETAGNLNTWGDEYAVAGSLEIRIFFFEGSLVGFFMLPKKEQARIDEASGRREASKSHIFLLTSEMQDG